MGNSTIYDVRLRYQLEGQAERQLQGITRESMRAAQANRDLSSSLREVAALVGAGAAIAKGKELFVGYNAEIEQLRIRMAAMLEQSDLAKTFESATQQAGQLFQEFQKFAITSPVTTKELVEFSAGVAQAVAQAGQGTKAIANITEMGMTAAQAMGFEAHYAARELSEGLAGTANSRMLFLKQLVGSQKMTLEEFRKLDAQAASTFSRRRSTPTR
jgi:hypothetical protein